MTKKWRLIFLAVITTVLLVACGKSNTELLNCSSGETEENSYSVGEIVRINGRCYINTGYISSMGRCGMMDGEIDSVVDATEVPKEDNQSNFGTGYAYQVIDDMKLLVVINGEDFIFRDMESSDSEIPDEVARFNAEVKEVRNGALLVSYASAPEEFNRIPNYDYVVSTENLVGDVVVGDTVTIWFSGSIRETSPAQIDAYRIKKAEVTNQSALEITEQFFSAFELADYESMKDYCTSSCIEQYFHDNDVNGMVWAKIAQLGEEEKTNENKICVLVTVHMETIEGSALYPNTETSFYVELQKQEDGKLLINSFPTGK